MRQALEDEITTALRPIAANGGRWPSDWIEAWRLAERYHMSRRASAHKLVKVMNEAYQMLAQLKGMLPDNDVRTRTSLQMGDLRRATSEIALLEDKGFQAGIVAAAEWVRARAEAYDKEHGHTEPDTNARVYPGTGEDYMSELEAIEDGLRAIAQEEKKSTPADLQRLRDDGWMVAAHNDYRQQGNTYTFWLMVKDDWAVKGEGATDEEALAQIAARAFG